MPRNGSGTYTAPSNSANPAVPFTTISSAAHNAVLTDLVAALTDSLSRSGSGGMQAELAMGGFKVTGAADGSANTDLATVGQMNARVQPVDRGGTNLTSYTIGDILYASGATTLSKLAGVATGNALISGGVGAAPLYGKIGLTTHVSGTLPIANGGTGEATAAAAFGALKQAATTTATGVVELATDAETQAQASTSVAITASNLAQRVAFFAHKNSTNQTTITSGVETKLTFGTESYDIGGYYDTSTSRFTPPAGRYFISAVALTAAGGVDQAAFGLLIYKNGVRYRADFDSWSGTTNKSARVNATVEANGTDYFEIFFVGFGAGDKTINGAADSTYFSAGAI